MIGARAARWRDTLLVAVVALAARAAVVLWAGARFPPAADGTFYHLFATRLAAGQGYTFLWPDGAVTAVAHYPVGYPALLAPFYALFGAKPVVAMAVAAALGALAAAALHRLSARELPPRLALAAGLLFAVHPALVPYTAALMTEGITASLFVLLASLAGARDRSAAAMPLAIRAYAPYAALAGLAILIRPQALLLVPLLPLLLRRGALRGRLVTAALVTAGALAVVAPWTARNCREMHRCALVSVNGGWNLLIGAHAEGGSWSPVEVPPACREVWDEAGKDACFEGAARRDIRNDLPHFLALAPKKLAHTFEYVGAAGYYLNASAPAAFPEPAKRALGAVETAALRALLVAALLTASLRPLRRPRPATLLAAGGVALLGLVSTTLGYGLLAALAFVPRGRAGAPSQRAFAAVFLTTALVHAVFFGAGRYGLVVLPFVLPLAVRAPATLLAALRRASRRAKGAPPARGDALARGVDAQ